MPRALLHVEDAAAIKDPYNQSDYEHRPGQDHEQYRRQRDIHNPLDERLTPFSRTSFIAINGKPDSSFSSTGDIIS